MPRRAPRYLNLVHVIVWADIAPYETGVRPNRLVAQLRARPFLLAGGAVGSTVGGFSFSSDGGSGGGGFGGRRSCALHSADSLDSIGSSGRSVGSGSDGVGRPLLARDEVGGSMDG